jgi:hypothetical protein
MKSMKLPTLNDMLDGGDREPPVVIDRSTLERWANCPQQAAMIEEKGEQIVGDIANAGSEIHRVMGEVMRLRQDKGMPEDTLRDYMHVEALKCRPDVQPTVAPALKGYAYDFCRFLCRTPAGEGRHPDDILRYDGGKMDRSGQCATQFTPASDVDGGVILTCEVDLLLSGASKRDAELHDWKGGWKHWTATDVRNSFQFGTFYPFVVMALYPDLEQLHVVVHSVRHKAMTLPVTMERRHMDGWGDRLHQACNSYLGVREGADPEAWPSIEKCRICPVSGDCRWVGADADDIPDLVKKYMVSKKNVDGMKKKLDAHVRVHGDIILEEGVAYGTNKPKPAPRFSAGIYKPGANNDPETGTE